MGNLNDDNLDRSAADDSSGEDRFWSELCAELGRADAASAGELADAEQLLAGLDDDEVAPLAPETIAQLQRSAMTTVGPEQRDDADADADAPRGGSVLSGRFSRYVAAAAAVLVVPKFLAAAALVTIAVTTSYFLTHTTKNLPFLEAINILVNKHADDASRGPAQGRVAMDVIESLIAMRALDGDDPELRRHAEAVRGSLLALSHEDPELVVRHFDASLDELIDPMLDQQLSLQERHEAIDRLAAQLRYGVIALRSARSTLSPPLLEGNDVYFIRMRDVLR